MDFSKGFLKRLLPAAAALALFFVVSALYFAPQFRGEVLPQHDVLQYEGMARDITDMRASTGVFGGMPAYLISVAYPAQLVKRTAGQIVKAIDTPAGFIFFAMTAMWCMLLMAGVNPWVGTVPALAYGLSTYFLLIIGAGHVTKMWALVYAPDDGRRMGRPARQRLVRRGRHGPRRIARNRRQPSADHLLFPRGDGRILGERGRRGLP